MSDNLYELTKDYKQFLDMDFEGDAFKDTLQALETSIQDKGKNIALVLEEWNGNTLVIDEQLKRLQARKKTINNKKTALKEWLKFNMESSGIDKIESDLFTITLGKAPKNTLLIVDDENAIPMDYKKVSYSVDKVSIKKAIKDGYEVKGCRLTDGARGLRIK